MANACPSAHPPHQDDDLQATLARRCKARAAELTAAVFRHADLRHPAVATLLRLGVERRTGLVLEGSRDPDLRKEQAFFRGLAGVRQTPRGRPLGIDPDAIVTPELNLPSPPRAYVELSEIIANPYAGAAEIAEIIGRDVSLTARLLKLVNSPYYGVGRRVDSMAKAVAILGTTQISLLAAAMSVMSEFKGIPRDVIDLESFWRHSLAVGVLARLISQQAGRQAGQGAVNAEQFFLAGLLHDIGRLILFKSRPEVARQALLKAREQQMFLYDAEQEEIGYDHSTLGSVLFRKWNLPAGLRLAVLYHHIPEISDNVAENAVIHLADIMSRAMGYGMSGEYFLPSLSEGAWESLGLAPEALNEVAEQAGRVLTPLLAAMH